MIVGLTEILGFICSRGNALQIQNGKMMSSRMAKSNAYNLSPFYRNQFFSNSIFNSSCWDLLLKIRQNIDPGAES